MSRRIGTPKQVHQPVSKVTTGVNPSQTEKAQSTTSTDVTKETDLEKNSFVTGEHRGIDSMAGRVPYKQPDLVIRPSELIFSSIDAVRDSFESYEGDESLSPEVFWNTNNPIDKEWKHGREVSVDRTITPGGSATTVTHTDRQGWESVERARENGISLPDESTRGTWTKPVSVALAQWWTGKSLGKGVRAVKGAMIEGDNAQASAKSTLYAEARTNVGAGVRVLPYGVDGGGWAKTRVVAAGVQVKGEIKSKPVKIAGQDVNVSLGAKAQPFVGAEAGSFGWVDVNARNGKAVLDLGANAFAGAKALANVDFGVKDGELFRLRATGEAWAGVGADVGVSVGFSKGRFSLGASAGAGLGIGGKVGFEVDIDVVGGAKMAAKLGHQAIDRDGDGKIRVNDAAAGVSQGLNLGAAAVEKGADGFIAALDGDGDGKFSLFDLQVRASQAGTVVKEGVQTVGKGIQSGVQATAQGVHSALDRDGDGKLSSADIGAGLGQAGDAIVDAGRSVRDFGQKVGTVSAALGRGAMADIKDAGAHIKGKASEMGQSIHSAVDMDGNGKLEFNDVRVAGERVGQAVRTAASDTVAAVKDGASAVVSGAKATKDAVVDGLGNAAQAVGHAADAVGDGFAAAGQAVHNGLDRDGDGSLGLNDIRHGAGEVAEALNAAGKAGISAVKSGARAVSDGIDSLGDGFQAAGQGVHSALDRDGDGSLSLNDVAAGAQQASQAIRDGAVAVGDGIQAAGQAVRHGAQAVASGAKGLAKAAKDEISMAGSTLKDGAVQAYERAKEAVHRVSEFLGFSE